MERGPPSPGAGLPCRLVSTQLIEAGVDVDFPLVFRELAPFDSIIQAAGRCNREGKLAGVRWALGRLPQRGRRRETADATFLRDLWYKGGRDVVEPHFLRNNREPEVDDPDAIREYFQRVYRVGSLDKHKIGRLRDDLQFREVARLYRLIDDAGLPVVVPTWEATARRNRTLDRVVSRRREPGSENSPHFRSTCGATRPIRRRACAKKSPACSSGEANMTPIPAGAEKTSTHAGLYDERRPRTQQCGALSPYNFMFLMS